jgi:hypothetical protein
MGEEEYKLKSELLMRAAEVVNAYKSEQVQLRVIDALIAALPNLAASEQQ